MNSGGYYWCEHCEQAASGLRCEHCNGPAEWKHVGLVHERPKRVDEPAKPPAPVDPERAHTLFEQIRKQVNLL